MAYRLGAKSRANLIGVHSRLADLIPTALARCPVDFGTTEGQVRTVAEQREKVRQGVSKTMNSRHLVEADGSARRPIWSLASTASSRGATARGA